MHASKRYSVLAAIMMGSIMGPIDSSIVNVILPTISSYFSVSIATAQWIPMTYLFCISSLLLFYGRLGDLLGYRKVYLTGIAGFVITSALCGFSPTIYWLIICRALQGLAAGMMMAVSHAIITASFPPEQRGHAMGINAISVSAGLAIGPSLGGFITSLLGWRFIFFINIPFGIAGLLWGFKVIPYFNEQQKKIDIAGAITAFLFFFSIMLCVNLFQTYGLTFLTCLMVLITFLLGAFFIVIESRSSEPMVNLRLFKNLTFTLANISALLNFMSQYVLVFLTPFYLHGVLNYTPYDTGLIMVSFPLSVLVIAPISGSLSDKIGTKKLACFGTALCSVSLFSMSQLSSSFTPSDLIWRLALFGLGTGIFQSPNTSAAMGSVPPSYLGIASGILATIRNAGMLLGIATAAMVLYAFVPSDVLQMSTLNPSEILAFLSGLKSAYVMGGIFAGIAVLTSLVSPHD